MADVGRRFAKRIVAKQFGSDAHRGFEAAPGGENKERAGKRDSTDSGLGAPKLTRGKRAEDYKTHDRDAQGGRSFGCFGRRSGERGLQESRRRGVARPDAGNNGTRFHFARIGGESFAGISPAYVDAGISGAGRPGIRNAAVDEIVRRSGCKIPAGTSDEGAGGSRAQSGDSAESGPAAACKIYSGRAPADHRAGAGTHERQGGVRRVGVASGETARARPSCAWRRCSSFRRKWCKKYR